MIANLRAIASSAPLAPGCYLMRSNDGTIIYIGKAKLLRNRLKSYFYGRKDPKTTTLLKHVFNIETIIVQNEYEALLLENTLIKQHSPKYNISLKDGKTYPVIRITGDKYPKVFRTRRVINDGSRYFGPFPQIHTIDALLILTEKIFPIRKCKEMRKRTSPCIYYHIGRCKAPCCGKITQEEYAKYINQLVYILSGKSKKSIREFTNKMNEASLKLEFERAAEYRNVIEAIKAISTSGTVTGTDASDRDYISYAQDGVFYTFSVFQMRSGRLSGQDLFRTCSAASEIESLGTFLLSYYSKDRFPAPVIFVQRQISDLQNNGSTPARGGSGEDRNVAQRSEDFVARGRLPPSESYSFDSNTELYAAENTAESPSFWSNEGFYRYFNDTFKFVPKFCYPKEKRDAAALAMAYMNVKEDISKRLKERGTISFLEDLRRELNLKTTPRRIEGFDIAQLNGKFPVASLVSFKDGMPDKKNYRYFRLKTVVGIVDDFAAVREAVLRRYSRLLRENADLPDLILIDGGIGQVNAARDVLKELGCDIDIAGLAKRDEEIWLPQKEMAGGFYESAKPICLPKTNEGLKILQHVRDETHRFATGLNQRLRSKDIKLSVLESIDGIGKVRAAKIIKEFGALDAIIKTEPEDIAKRLNMNIKLARIIRHVCILAEEDARAKLEEN
ncbi:MAG: excinuclease ABC subunit UvrC [Termitinemataceae bacterium]|nr:MAG: excinuclease ABC subunit UvrC [Termitinemataceae bacterium]